MTDDTKTTEQLMVDIERVEASMPDGADAYDAWISREAADAESEAAYLAKLAAQYMEQRDQLLVEVQALRAAAGGAPHGAAPARGTWRCVNGHAGRLESMGGTACVVCGQPTTWHDGPLAAPGAPHEHTEPVEGESRDECGDVYEGRTCDKPAGHHDPHEAWVDYGGEERREEWHDATDEHALATPAAAAGGAPQDDKVDKVLTCASGCGDTPHRFRPSPEAGYYWRCSECGDITPAMEPRDKSAAEKALDDIAALCGCPEWDYPGQVVRDVKQAIAAPGVPPGSEVFQHVDEYGDTLAVFSFPECFSFFVDPRDGDEDVCAAVKVPKAQARVLASILADNRGTAGAPQGAAPMRPTCDRSDCDEDGSWIDEDGYAWCDVHKGCAAYGARVAPWQQVITPPAPKNEREARQLAEQRSMAPAAPTNPKPDGWSSVDQTYARACIYGIQDGKRGVWIDGDGLNVEHDFEKRGAQWVPVDAVLHVLAKTGHIAHPGAPHEHTEPVRNRRESLQVVRTPEEQTASRRSARAELEAMAADESDPDMAAYAREHLKFADENEPPTAAADRTEPPQGYSVTFMYAAEEHQDPDGEVGVWVAGALAGSDGLEMEQDDREPAVDACWRHYDHVTANARREGYIAGLRDAHAIAACWAHRDAVLRSAGAANPTADEADSSDPAKR